MKKIKVAMLGLCLILGLSACGNETENVTNVEQSKVSEVKNEPDMEEIVKEVVGEETTTLTNEEMEVALEAALEAYVAEEKAIEASKEAEEAKVVESIVAERTPVAPKQEILDAEWDSGMVQFNDIIVQLPIKLSEMVELGFDYEVYGKSKDYLFAKEESEIIHFYLDGENYIKYIMQSNMEGFHTAEEIDPLITEIQIYEMLLSDVAKAKVDIYFPGGIQLGDEYTVIEERLGTAHDISRDMTYTYGSMLGDTVGISFYNGKDSHKIHSVWMIKALDAGDMNTIESITFGEWNYGNSTATVSMNYISDYEIYDESMGGAGVVAMFKDSGVMFSMSTYMAFANTSTYVKPYGDVVYEQTDADGTVRKIYIFEEESFFDVIKGDRVITGYIYLMDTSNQNFDNKVDEFLPMVTDIINSIQF